MTTVIDAADARTATVPGPVGKFDNLDQAALAKLARANRPPIPRPSAGGDVEEDWDRRVDSAGVVWLERKKDQDKKTGDKPAPPAARPLDVDEPTVEGLSSAARTPEIASALLDPGKAALTLRRIARKALRRHAEASRGEANDPDDPAGEARAGGTQERGPAGRQAGGPGLGNTANNSASPAEADPLEEACRADRRYAMRAFAWRYTKLGRLRSCGRNHLPDQVAHVRQAADGKAYMAGVQRCGSIWACPPCSAKIRQRRSEDITRAVVEHMNRGGTVWLVTLTARHHRKDSLAAMLKALPKAWGNLTSGGAYCGESDNAYLKRLERWETGPRGRRRGKPRPVQRIGERDRAGVVGWIRSVEITLGKNGWHPHLHVLVLINGESDALELAKMQLRWKDTWRRDLGKSGFEPNDKRGVRWDKAIRVTEAAEYVAKIQEKDWPIGMELARGDLKSGKLGDSLTPFQILDYARQTGDMAALPIWWEYEKATKGLRAIQWSYGLRVELLGDDQEQTDEEIAEEEVGGEVVAEFEAEAWAVVVDVDGMYGAVLRAVEAGGYVALVELLAPYGVAPSRPRTPKPTQ